MYSKYRRYLRANNEKNYIFKTGIWTVIATIKWHALLKKVGIPDYIPVGRGSWGNFTALLLSALKSNTKKKV